MLLISDTKQSKSKPSIGKIGCVVIKIRLCIKNSWLMVAILEI